MTSSHQTFHAPSMTSSANKTQIATAIPMAIEDLDMDKVEIFEFNCWSNELQSLLHFMQWTRFRVD